MERIGYGLLIACCTLVGSPRGTPGQVPVERQFEFLLSMQPSAERDQVTLLLPDGESFQIHRRGTNSIECVADEPGDDNLSLLCYHKSMGPFLKHQRRMASRGLAGEAFWERVCGDVEVGMVEVPDQAYVLSASARLSTDGTPPDSIVVYHLLQLPYATGDSLGLPEEEVVPGAPWIHHAGNCDAHVMWSEVRPF